MTIFHALKYPVADILKKWDESKIIQWNEVFPDDISDKIVQKWISSPNDDYYSVEMIIQVLMDYEGPLG